MATLTNVSLRLPVELIERIEYLAKATGRSRTFYMKKAIELYIVDLETIYFTESEQVNASMEKQKKK